LATSQNSDIVFYAFPGKYVARIQRSNFNGYRNNLSYEGIG